MEHLKLSGIICIGLFVFSADGHQYERRPIGPRMCNYICFRIQGCRSYMYGATRLSCITGNRSHLLQLDTEFSLLKIRKEITHKTENCKDGAMIFYTRKKFIQCRSQTVSRGTNTMDHLHFLMVEESHASGRFCSYFPSSDFQQLHRHPSGRYIYSVINISENKLLISSHPGRVYISELDKNMTISLMSKVVVKDMTSNREENYVYMIGIPKHDSKNHLWKMTMIDRHVEHIRKLQFIYCKQIEMYPEAKQIYISCSNSVYVCDLNGVLQQVIIQQRNPTSISVDVYQGVMYYNKFKMLMKMDLSNFRMSRVMSLPFRPYRILYHRNSIYLTSYKVKDKSAMYEVKGNTIRIFKRLNFSKFHMLMVAMGY